MNEQRLIDANAIPYGSYLGDDEPRVYKSQIDAMPTIDPVKWIPVNERLPEQDCDVLIRCKNEAMFVAYLRRWGSEEEIIWNTRGPLGTGRRIATARVTHWMPLPEPPKEE